MLKNHTKSGFFAKTLKLIRYFNFKIKKYIIINVVRVLPRTLLTRILLYFVIIVFASLVGLFIYIYDNQWRKIRYKLILGVANDIYYSGILINNNYLPSNIPSIVYQNFYRFNIIDNPNLNILTKYNTNTYKLTKNAKILKKILNSFLPYPFYLVKSNKKDINVLVLLSASKWCEFYISENVFFISSLESMVIYTFIIYIILIIVSYIFFKILLRPLKSLSEYVTLFGKGQKVKYLRPRGALEIRNTIKSFNEMKERINRHIEQRTLMLSGISHDLKSTLTKMSLIIELSEKNRLNKELLEEITNMNQMLSNYLTFANDEYNEEPKKMVNIKTFFKNILQTIQSHKEQKIQLEYLSIYNHINIKPITLKRAILNILNNSIRYANFIKIIIKDDHNKHLKIIIDDNGPGIDPKEYKNVFKPFVRLNVARTVEEDSVGLGLSIAKDAVNKHGGNILLAKSPYNGLRVTILIPY